MPAPLVVQKFGGSSLADADRIRRVARRIARERATGSDLVVVVSAMGDTTDELLALAAGITDEPDSRELDVLLATGEHQSATLLSMALHALGLPAISLPLHWTEAELPVGVQLTGGPWQEATLISLAAQLEQALPWAERRPSLLATA